MYSTMLAGFHILVACPNNNKTRDMLFPLVMRRHSSHKAPTHVLPQLVLSSGKAILRAWFPCFLYLHHFRFN
jgi:hypothetical protein